MLTARYVFTGGQSETRDIVGAESWPVEIQVQFHPASGPRRMARLVRTDDYYSSARVYREEEVVQ